MRKNVGVNGLESVRIRRATRKGASKLLRENERISEEE
jgi:hypothetical protein